MKKSQETQVLVFSVQANDRLEVLRFLPNDVCGQILLSELYY